MDFEVIIIAAAGISGFVLTRRYLRRASNNNGLERVAPPSAATPSGDGRAVVTAAEMDEVNRAARLRRLDYLASRW